MAKAFEKYGQCKFTVSNENIDRMYPVVWSFQKKWRYTDVFNHRLLIYYTLNVSMTILNWFLILNNLLLIGCDG